MALVQTSDLFMPYRNTEKTSQKIITILMFLVLGLSTVGFSHDDLIINEEALTFLVPISAVLAIILIYYFSRKKTDDKNQQEIIYQVKIDNKNILSWLKEKLVALIILLVILLFFIYGIARGVPILVHYALPTKAFSLELTVKKIRNSYSNKSCNGAIYFSELMPFVNEHVCGFSYDFWKSLQKGEKVVLSGRQSVFVFEYESYKKANNGS